jgi:hypothetical protein
VPSLAGNRRRPLSRAWTAPQAAKTNTHNPRKQSLGSAYVGTVRLKKLLAWAESLRRMNRQDACAMRVLCRFLWVGARKDTFRPLNVEIVLIFHFSACELFVKRSKFSLFYFFTLDL